MTAGEALARGGAALGVVLSHCEFQTVLDVGAGSGEHSAAFSSAGKTVTAIDIGRSVYFDRRSDPQLSHVRFLVGDYMVTPFDEPFDLIWACHVLEHQVDPGSFLRKIRSDLSPSGWLAVTVPPLKHQIVGGHVTLWNAGLLIYNLVLAGFDCSAVMVRKYGYNISAIVQKGDAIDHPELHMDHGDIDRLSGFFPPGLREGFNGDIDRLNWPV